MEKIFENNILTINLEDICPICQEKNLHQYYPNYKVEKVKYKKKFYKGLGCLWQWYGSCFHYRFIHSVYVPLNWSCDIKVEEWKLIIVLELFYKLLI